MTALAKCRSERLLFEQDLEKCGKDRALAEKGLALCGAKRGELEGELAKLEELRKATLFNISDTDDPLADSSAAAAG